MKKCPLFIHKSSINGNFQSQTLRNSLACALAALAPANAIARFTGALAELEYPQ